MSDKHGQKDHGHKHEGKPEKVAPTAAYIEGCTDPVELATIAQEYADLSTTASTRLGALAAAPQSAAPTNSVAAGVVAGSAGAGAGASAPAGDIPVVVTAATEVATPHHHETHAVAASVTVPSEVAATASKQAMIDKFNHLGPVGSGKSVG